MISARGPPRGGLCASEESPSPLRNSLHAKRRSKLSKLACLVEKDVVMEEGRVEREAETAVAVMEGARQRRRRWGRGVAKAEGGVGGGVDDHG